MIQSYNYEQNNVFSNYVGTKKHFIFAHPCIVSAIEMVPDMFTNFATKISSLHPKPLKYEIDPYANAAVNISGFFECYWPGFISLVIRLVGKAAERKQHGK